MGWRLAEAFIFDGTSGLGKMHEPRVSIGGVRGSFLAVHLLPLTTERQRGLSMFKIKFQAFWPP